MRGKLQIIALNSLRVAAAAFAVVIAAFAFLFWRVNQGPLSLGWAIPVVTSALDSRFGEGSVEDISSMTLSKGQRGDGYRLEIKDLQYASGDITASLPIMQMQFHPRDALTAHFGPREIVLVGVQLRIYRQADRRFALDFGAAGPRANPFRTLTGGRYFRQAFERAELRDASIDFVDAASGRSWISKSAAARIERNVTGYSVSIDGAFLIGGLQASVDFDAEYRVDKDTIEGMAVLENAPLGDLAAIFIGAPPDVFTGPVSGVAQFSLSGDGEVRSASVKGRAHAGSAKLGNFDIAVDAAELDARFNPVGNMFDIERLTVNSDAITGLASGAVSLRQSPADNRLTGLQFAVVAAELILAPAGVFQSRLDVDRISLAGEIDFAGGRVDVQDIDAAFLGVNAKGSMRSVRQAGGARSALKGFVNVEGELDRDELLMAWPLAVADAAREFVDQRIRAATFRNIRFLIDLPAGAEDKLVGDDALSLTFEAADAEVIYATTMTPLVGVSGRGRLGLNTFRFDADRGWVGNIRLTDGQVDFPVLRPKGENGFYRFHAEGDAGDALALLDQEPLRILKETPVAPDQFAGPFSADIEISRPNRREAAPEEYGYKGTAKFNELAISNAVGDIDISGAHGELTLSSRDMSVKARAQIAATDMSIIWNQRFYGGGDRARIQLEGELNSSTGDFLGMPTRQFLQGPVMIRADLKGDLAKLTAAELDADFKRAALSFPSLGWSKPAGAVAAASINARFQEDGSQTSSVSLTGAELEIVGTATFGADGSIRNAAFPKFLLGQFADVSLAADRTQSGALAARLTGRLLNLGPMIEEFIAAERVAEGERFSFGPGLTVASRIDELRLRNNVSVRDVSFDLRHGDHLLETLNVSGRTGGNLPISLTLKRTGEGDDRLITMRSGDIGALLGGIFGVSSVNGGEGVIEATLKAAPQGSDEKLASGAGSAAAGRFEARDLRIVGAPLLARIFSAGSLNGLTDLLNGSGIELNRASGEYELRAGLLNLSEVRASGPSVGITVSGEAPLAADSSMSLSGAVIPAYQVNSFLGRAPIIGDLIVGREGEGILAVAYTVTGPNAEPRVTINPLSALAPGILRRMFDPVWAEPLGAPMPSSPAEPKR